MPRRPSIKTHLVTCTALLGSMVVLSSAACAQLSTTDEAAPSDTTRRAPPAFYADYPHTNPYEQRRAMVQQQRHLQASSPDNAEIAAAAQDWPEAHQPMRITIPNINAASHTPPAASTLSASADDGSATGTATAHPSAADTTGDSTDSGHSLIERVVSALIPDTSPPAPPLPPAITPPSSRQAELPPTELPVPQTITSPGAIIKREELHMATMQPDAATSATPQQLAAMAPAAGTPTPNVNVPLIQPTDTPVPENPVPPAPNPVVPAAENVPMDPLNIGAIPLVSPQDEPTPTPVADTAAKPPLPSPDVLNKPLPAPGNAPAPGAAAAPAPGNLPPLVEPPPAHNEAATIEQIPVAPLVQPPPQAAPAAAIAHYVPATPAAPLPAPVTASDTTPPVKAIAPLTAPVTDIASEPDRELSPESKKLLRKFPAHLDSPAKTKGKLQVDHAKNTPKNLNDDNASVKHEAMGIKIEIKKPRMDMDYQLEQAYNALVAGQTDAAIDLYKGVLNNEPNNTNALFGLATLYHRAGQIDMARPLYARLLSVNPNHRDGLNNFLVLLGDESPDEALRQMQELQTRNPNFSPIPAQMALIYQKMGDVDKANEKMMQAIDLAPENLTYRYNLAIMLDKQKKYDEAAKLYAQIVEAYERGDPTPGNIQKIQQRLTFISSNRP